MSIPVFPATMPLPSRTLPNEATEFHKLKREAADLLRERYGIEVEMAAPGGAKEDSVREIVLKFEQIREDAETFETLLPWLVEFTFHRLGGSSEEDKAQLPQWYWETILLRAITMGRWEGLRYVSEDAFYEGMGLFASQQAFGDWTLIHFWRHKRTDDMGDMPDNIIENMYRTRVAAK
jgi:hypothetical protein